MRLVLCDDHRLFMEALASALNGHGHEVVGSTASPDEVVRVVARERPDVCLLDMTFPEGSGLDAARAIRELTPATQVLLLSVTSDPAVLAEALEVGVTGFVRKDESIRSVLVALAQLEAGQVAIDPARLRGTVRVSRAGARPGATEALRHLTERERDVLRLIVRGATTNVIADMLHISVSTTRTHVQNILVKLGVHSRLEAAALVAEHRDDI
jgi:two-component system nitrate/nitrite response regulator NarL